MIVSMQRNSTDRVIKKSGWISITNGKALTALIMLVTVLIAIFLPILIFGRLNISRMRATVRDKLQLWIGRLSCFAAGVFLSTGFMDIFPDVMKSIEDAGSKLNIKIIFPLASFFTLIGFFLMLSIEQMIFIYKDHLKKFSPNHQHDPPPNHDTSEDFLPSVTSSNDTMLWTEQTYKDVNHSTNSILEDYDHGHHHVSPDAVHDHDEHGDIFHHNTSRIFALMLAMSLHAIFEGLAIGLGTSVADVTHLFIALSMHKWVIAASLGLNLGTAQLKIWVKVVVSLIFAFASPIGIGLGIFIMSQESSYNAVYMVAGVLEGMACGTFLYVVFFEILPHELGHNTGSDRGTKLACVIIGFIFVSLYILLIPGNDN